MIKVIKFGGTIINNPKYQNQILKIINNEIGKSNKLLIVVSAIGRDNDSYSTSTFEKLGNNLNNVEKAELLSYGERISSLVFLNFLLSNKYKAKVVDINEIGINLKNDYLNGDITSLDNTNIIKCLDNFDIVVVPGFIGLNRGKVGLLGKGGSDLTAICLAKMLGLNSIDLYKDVNGVMSGDPKIIASPITINNLSYDELILFAKCGAKVVQEKAIKMAKDEDIMINVFSIDSLEVKTKISNQNSNLDFKGVLSKQDKIFLIGNIKKLDCEHICKLLEFYNFECLDKFNNDNYLEIKIQGGKRNFAMNVLHHHFICKN